MRLIDADELEDIFQRSSLWCWSIKEDKSAHDWAKFIIDNAPTIDAVEVVRCKDCDNRFYDKDRNLYYCTMYYGMGDVHDENYCSFGERKD